MRYLLTLSLLFVPLLLLNCQQPQELTKKVDAQAEEIRALKEQVNTLNADLEALKTAFEEHMTKFHPAKPTKPTTPTPSKPTVPPKPPVKKNVGGG